jgi:hypothetical protein
MSDTYYRMTDIRAAWFERSRKGITVQLRQDGGISHTRQAHSTRQACAMINAWLKDGTLLEESQMSDEELHEERQRYLEGEIASARAEINTMLYDQVRRENQARRRNARLFRKICPPLSLVFALLAWCSFTYPAMFTPDAWIACAFTSLMCLILLVLGVVLNRPMSLD